MPTTPAPSPALPVLPELPDTGVTGWLLTTAGIESYSELLVYTMFAVPAIAALISVLATAHARRRARR